MFASEQRAVRRKVFPHLGLLAPKLAQRVVGLAVLVLRLDGEVRAHAVLDVLGEGAPSVCVDAPDGADRVADDLGVPQDERRRAQRRGRRRAEGELVGGPRA